MGCWLSLLCPGCSEGSYKIFDSRLLSIHLDSRNFLIDEPIENQKNWLEENEKLSALRIREK